MEIRLCFKTPDVVEDAIRDAIDSERARFLALHDVETEDELDEASAEELSEKLWELKDQAKQVCNRWFQFGEVVNLVVDTEAETISVQPAMN